MIGQCEECSRGYMVHCFGEEQMGLMFTVCGKDGCGQESRRNKENTSGQQRQNANQPLIFFSIFRVRRLQGEQTQVYSCEWVAQFILRLVYINYGIIFHMKKNVNVLCPILLLNEKDQYSPNNVDKVNDLRQERIDSSICCYVLL